MRARKTKKATAKKRIGTAIDTTKKRAKKINTFAVKTTDEVVSESLIIFGQWQGVAEKAIQEGLKLAANQQELIFDSLHAFKVQFKRGKKRAKKLFA